MFMRKKFKRNLMLFIFLLLGIIVVMPKSIKLYANSNISLDELLVKFTDYDNFYDEENDSEIDGNIRDYIDNYYGKNLKEGKITDDAIKYIIPKRLFLEENTSDYIGKNYGFYISTKRNNPSDAFLVSYVYVFDVEIELVSNLREQKTKVSPLFQCQFVTVFKEDYDIDLWNYYYDNDLSEVINKNTQLMDIHYMHNVQFGYSVLNENQLNFGDVGYDKEIDSGAIISQTRYNYKGLVLVENTFEERVAALSDLLLGSIPVVSTVFNTLDFIDNLSSISRHEYKELIYNNDENIITNMSREEQLSRGNLSKVSVVSPSNDTKIYQRDHYAQSVCVLDTVAVNTRLYTVISIDLWNSQEKIATIKNSFYHILKPSTIDASTLSLNSENCAYLLPDGEHTFKFIPQNNSDYSFDSINNLTYEINNEIINNNEEVFLSAGNPYYITVKGIGKAQYYFSINAKKLNISESKNIESSVGLYLTQVTANQNGIFNISSNKNVVKIYDNTFNEVEYINGLSTSKDFIGRKDNKYYILFNNDSSSNLIATVSIIQTSLGTSNNLNTSSNFNYFYFTSPSDISDSGEYFCFESYPKGVIIFYDSINLNNISSQVTTLHTKTSTLYNIKLFKNQKVIIGIKTSIATNVNLSINKLESSYSWVVNDVELNNNYTTLKRGEQIKIDLMINNKLVDEYRLLTANNYLYPVTEYPNDFYFEAPINARLEREVIILSGFPDAVILNVDIIPEWDVNISIIDNNQEIAFDVTFLSDSTNTIDFYYRYTINNQSFYYTKYNLSFNEPFKTINFDNPNDNYVGAVTLEIIWIELKDGINKKTIYINQSGEPYTMYIQPSRLHTKYGNIPSENNEFGNGINSYLISNSRHFNNIYLKPNSTFQQTNNINMSSTNPKLNFTFTGYYHGNNYEIQNVNLRSHNSSVNFGGMFGKSTGIIADVVMRNLNIDAISYISTIPNNIVYVGGIVGINEGSIVRCKVYGNIKAFSTGANVGGIAGKGSSYENYILDCSNYAIVSSYGNVGGIVGHISDGLVDSCKHFGEVNLYIYDSINRSAGGIAGYAIYTDINYCTVLGMIKYNSPYSSSITLAPRMGNIAGTFKYGLHRNNAITYTVEFGTLSIIKYKCGLFKTCTWDQRQYVKQFESMGEYISL